MIHSPWSRTTEGGTFAMRRGAWSDRMAKRFEPPDDNTLAAATVDGIFRWGTGGQAGQSEKWQPKVDTWEVVIPEVTWRRT